MPLTSAIPSYCYTILVGKISLCLPMVLFSDGSDDDDDDDDVSNGIVVSN